MVLGPVEAWKIFFQVLQFGQVVVDDIGIIGIVLEEILVIVFRGIECLERLRLRDDGPGIDFGGIELRDVGLSDAFLVRAGIENQGTILRTSVGPLAVPLRGIMRNGEKNHQELAERDL